MGVTMSNPVLSQFPRPGLSVAPGATWAVAIVLAVWFVLVILLGARGAFVTPPGAPPLPILFAVMTPIIVSFAAFRTSRSFRDCVLAVDLRLMTAIQAWRFAGLGFLALYTHGVLPGIFAWPAGLGDIAIGVTAPWIIIALTRQPSFVVSKTFVTWNVLGMLDLVVAVSLGALFSALADGVPGEITTGPMAQLPLLLVPAYLVPIFIMLHAAALFQARRYAGTPVGSK
jgi:hypothetical protein